MPAPAPGPHTDTPQRRTGLTPSAPDSAAPRPDLPHERDQHGDTGSDGAPEVIRQAARDLDAGLVDTDLRGTPGADAQQRDELLRRERAAGQP